MYNVRKAVGKYFERKLGRIFGLIEVDIADRGDKPDLSTADSKIYFESKASHYKNGGVIKGNQLKVFEREGYDCLFAFQYHSLLGISKRFPSKTSLLRALKLRAMFIFPFEVVKSFYGTPSVRVFHHPHLGDMDFAQVTEKQAADIFNGDPNTWKLLGLDYSKYCRKQPHDKVNIMCKDEKTLEKLLDDFNPDAV